MCNKVTTTQLTRALGKVHTSAKKLSHFYAQKQLLLSAHLSHHNSVCRLSLCLSIRHTGESVKNGTN